MRTATEGGEPYPRATADLHVGLAELDRELDDLPSAESHLETARVLRERTSITENRHRWFVAMAQLRASAGDYDTAAQLLDEAEALYRRGFYPDTPPHRRDEGPTPDRRRRSAVGGRLGARAGVSVDGEPDYLREYEHLTLARLLLAQHRAGSRTEPADGAAPVAAALGLLERLHAAAAGARRDGSLLEIRVLQALAHHADGDLPGALAALGQALDEAPEPDGYVRLYLDEGAPMLDLLRAAADPGNGDAVDGEGGAAVQEHARRLLDRAQSASAVAETEQALADPLSQREREVLRLLDSDLTGPQIARELYVSVNTLRTHTKRIFTKLDVTTRVAAVRRAHERGLL